MNWGNIEKEYAGFGWKRLSSHEIDPKVSNGHEFQGVKALGELLGYEKLREIPTNYYLIEDDPEGNPVVADYIESHSSWYDSRERDAKRSAEWRLYYPAAAGRIQVRCRVGDLMVIGRRRNGSLSVLLIE